MPSHTDMEKRRPFKALAHSVSDRFDVFQEEMERFFGPAWRGLAAARLGFSGAEGDLIANLDMSETPESLQVVLDVPGLKEKDIDVSVNDHAVTIKGRRESHSEEKKKNFHRIERSFGEFTRRLELPCDVDRDRVDARLKDGVLTITLPKSAKAVENERKISVSAG